MKKLNGDLLRCSSSPSPEGIAECLRAESPSEKSILLLPEFTMLLA
jgi:hypothetical protein